MRPSLRLPKLPRVALLAVALLVPCSSLVAQASGQQKHMLFRVRSQTGAQVYILGSVHLLTPEAAKLPAEVDSAFAHARTIAFETNLDSVQSGAQELLARGRYAGGATLRSSLSPVGVAKTDSILKLYGLSLDLVNQFKPWLVSVLLTQFVMQKARFQPQYGVDVQLNTRAKQAGKTVVGLEPLELQLGIFDRIPAKDQEAMLTTSPSPDSAARTLGAIKDAWLMGNTALLDTLLNRTAGETPAFYSIMIVERNRSWIPKIEQLLAAKDNALIVVGAAHLVGRDGVLELLRAKGYTIEQM